MMQRSKKLLIALLGLSISGTMSAQKLLTIDNALEIAYQNSPDIQQSQLSLEQSRENLNAQKARLKSSFSLDVNPFEYSKNRRFIESVNSSGWNTTETTSSSGVFSINQPIKATDGTISLNNSFGWQSNYNQNENSTKKAFSNNVSLTLNQPLFTYNKTKLDLQTVELNLENTILNNAVQKLNIEMKVSQYYYNVYQKQQSLSIAKEEFSNQEKTLEIIKNKNQAGLSANEELWQAELNFENAKSAQYNAEVSLDNAKDVLKQILGLKLSEDINVLANTEAKPITIKLDDALTYALQQRMELRQQQIAIQNKQAGIITANAINEFKGNLALTVGLFGNNEKVNQVYDTPQDNEKISFSFQVPIWDWGYRRSKIKSAEASLKSSELDLESEKVDIEISLRQTYRNLQNLLNQIEIAKKSVENAQLTYALNLQKYENGDLTSMDLSLYQNQLSTKKNSLTSSLINYKLELLNLKIQTLWDFENNKSVVPKINY